MTHPRIIQGGMGVGVSNWRLAKAVSSSGELGVVSGTALSTVLVRRLQLGDKEGDVRRALAAFPHQETAQELISRYWVEGGIAADASFKLTPMPSLTPPAVLDRMTAAACFVEVFLAKEGHSGVIGMNLLEKIQAPTLASLYGAMLAGVDYILMGAGIPRAIPGVLDAFAAGRGSELRLDVEGALADETFVQTFDPVALGWPSVPLKRPLFLAIISSATLALTLAKKASGRVDGFVVEGEPAGGHNAPPRGKMELDALGQPIYGPKDVADLVKIRELGLPFWLAGKYATPGRFGEALEAGATGVQVGTAFAFCRESGISKDLVQQVFASNGSIGVFTDPRASPTGFPFKVAQIPGTLSQAEVYAERERVCDLGYLRRAYRKDDGSVGYRCPAEPVADFLAKGGLSEEIEGRKCLCNGLMATLELGQRRADGNEIPIVTAGNDIEAIQRYLGVGAGDYGAADVVRFIRGYVAAT
jgi:nitronate monooxygenase